MTFHARLSELIEKATKGRLSEQIVGLAMLGEFTLLHAEAIRDLVVAAHSAHQTLADEGFHAKALRLGQALAKLEEA